MLGSIKKKLKLIIQCLEPEVFGMLRNTFFSKDTELWRRLHTTYVKPHVEYSVQVWNPYAKKDIKTVGIVQRTATRNSRPVEAPDL